MRRTFHEFTNERKVFKQCYIGGCIGSIFVLCVGFLVHYYDTELNIAKWKGLVLGTLIQLAVLVAVYFLCRAVLALGIILFVAFFVHIFLFGIFYKTGLESKAKPKEKVEQPTNDDCLLARNRYLEWGRHWALEYANKFGVGNHYYELAAEIEKDMTQLCCDYELMFKKDFYFRIEFQQVTAQLHIDLFATALYHILDIKIEFPNIIWIDAVGRLGKIMQVESRNHNSPINDTSYNTVRNFYINGIEHFDELYKDK